MSISKEQVAHVAKLARLAFTDDELERFSDQLTKILAYADQVSALATDDVPPTAHALPLKNILRDDVVTPSLSQEKALSTAPEVEQDRFKVPRIMEAP
jgi:aspartyl-tRNA(Asn)/glutamyl-tRNA(Gln) amidotransferase subunit C